uniref:Uncharacterized protein n=1 Tax=Aegilops tauschii subsp. strangulata TaxID=200361 RepID=A0A453FUF4_AEGTS
MGTQVSYPKISHFFWNFLIFFGCYFYIGVCGTWVLQCISFQDGCYFFFQVVGVQNALLLCF